MKQKLFLLTPLGILILLETVFDASFFFSVPPRQVSCCTSLFDIPRENGLAIVTESTWLWVVLFYIMAVFIIAEIIFFLRAQQRSSLAEKGKWFGKKSVMLIETAIIILCFILFVLGLHTKISPLFLHTPFHHCIFCLCQEVWDALGSFSMIFTGLVLLQIYFWVGSSAKYKEVNNVLSNYMLSLLKWSGFLVTGGLLILTIHLFVVVWQ